jgi:hypothetical protein
LKSAFSGACAPGVGLRRREDGSVQAGRWLKAFSPIEIGLSRRDAPSVGLRRRRERFSVGAGRASAEGLLAD